MIILPQTKLILDKIIEKQEGGWALTANSDDPDGGWTYAGVTSNTWFKHFGVSTSYTSMAANIDNLSITVKDYIYAIYESDFIEPLQLEKLDFRIKGALLSCAINIGVEKAVKLYQKVINIQGKELKEDGVIGQLTIERQYFINTSFPNYNVTLEFCRQWQKYYIDLVQENAKAWRDYANSLYKYSGEFLSLKTELHPPKVLRATSLEGWINRIEFWR